ncbi:MAG: hypothetical protein RL693_1920 [Verrucomicrobiota bacterium]|jgi:hypothetical protein
MFPASFNIQLSSALLDWLWRSWISFGVSGHGPQARPDHVIDPEALVLASSQWARYDARLFDEMLDWLCLHGHLIHLQRLRNLQRAGLGDPRVLSAIAAVLVERASHSKWKALVSKPPLSQSLTPLFLNLGEQTPVWGAPDPIFAAQGFHRGRLELRQLSQPPDPDRAANFWLKLRSLFGASARAEILLQLLLTGPSTAADIARQSGFSARSVLLPLREMALSGHLHEPPRPLRNRPQRGQAIAARTRGPSLAYALRPEEWSFLRTWGEPAGFPKLESPLPLLLLCQNALALFPASPVQSAGLQSLQLREAVAAPLLEIQRLGLSGNYGLAPDLSGDRLAATLAERLPALISSL